MTTDEKWMVRALALAEKGRGRVHPNPMVGAVLVRAGRVVGEGAHRRFGGPHAEVEALRQAGRRARGSTLYVTLEPCSHWGKTPPCSDAIIQAGVRRVVAAMKDPNPLVSGRGFAKLRQARLHVASGVMEAEARALNRAFVTWVTKNRPYITLKAATSLDGRSATVAGDSKWITGTEARRAGYILRAGVDAIAVGRETVRVDNPSLNAHGMGQNPVRIVFDSKLRSPLRSKVFSKGPRTWCLATDHTVLRQLDQMKRRGVQIILCKPDADRRVDVRDAVKRLAARGIAHLLVEGGRTLHESFLQAGLVDEIVWFIAPMIMGAANTLKTAHRLTDVKVGMIGPDMSIRGRLRVRTRRR